MVRDNLPLPIDYKRLRHAAHVVSLADFVLRIEQNREVIPVLGDVRRNCGAALGILADREHYEILVALEIVVQRLHRRHFLATRLAPGRPHVEKNNFAAQRFERNRRPVELLELEIRRLTSSRYWRLRPAAN